jgi:hypothetical protein
MSANADGNTTPAAIETLDACGEREEPLATLDDGTNFGDPVSRFADANGAGGRR